jgi:hypothetical protein
MDAVILPNTVLLEVPHGAILMKTSCDLVRKIAIECSIPLSPTLDRTFPNPEEIQPMIVEACTLRHIKFLITENQTSDLDVLVTAACILGILDVFLALSYHHGDVPLQALVQAIIYQRLDIIDHLIATEIDLERSSTDKILIINLACTWSECLSRVMEHPQLINIDCFNFALLAGCKNRSLDVVKTIINHPQFCLPDSDRVLMVNTIRANPDQKIIKALISNSTVRRVKSIDSLLIVASGMGWIKTVAFILSNLETISQRAWYYSIKSAIISERSKVINLLLNDDRCDQGLNAYKFLHKAKQCQSKNIVKVLVHNRKIRGDVKVKDWSKETCLEAAEKIIDIGCKERYE